MKWWNDETIQVGRLRDQVPIRQVTCLQGPCSGLVHFIHDLCGQDKWPEAIFGIHQQPVFVIEQGEKRKQLFAEIIIVVEA